MSETTSTAYDYYSNLSSNEGATAAVVDMITKACTGAGGNSLGVLKWAAHENNVNLLRDKIKASAKE